MANNNAVHRQASALVQSVAKAVGNTYGFGNLTSSVYDTAWVSMVRKPTSAVPSLLFPECFQYVLDTQLDSGGWETCRLEIDGIMNTLGGLLALKRNADIPCQLSKEDFDKRAENAIRYLAERLSSWDVGSCDYVGFEILVPSLLAFLEQDGISFSFPGKELLMDLNQRKLAKIPSSVWSRKVQTTITHSLEAFVGKVNFSGLRQHLVHGSMCSSPSATAAYLMFASEWDEDAERYLHQVVSSRRPEGGGTGVPGMYPTTGFEVLWISCTLLDNGFDVESLEGITSAVLDITEEFYEELGGLVSGFSKSSVADADDTSRSIYIRNLLGKRTTAERLIKIFEGPDHFLSYMMERHPSVTTNCNALTAIIESPDSARYSPQVEKLAKYICASWCSPDLVFADKWNISEFYPIMLMCDCLVRLLYRWGQGRVTGLSDELITEKVPFVLWQALMRTLQKQNPDGSWGPKPSREITAYAIIALSNLASLPVLPELKCQIECAIRQGRTYILHAENASDVEYIWKAKTTYSPLDISKAYILAGLKANSPKYSLGSKIEELFKAPEKELQRYTHIFSKYGTLKGFPKWRILGCVVEGHFFLRRLKRLRHDIFDRNGMKNDEYLAFIPMTLSAANNLQRSFLEADILHDMMILILRIYQMDEYMEHVIGRDFGDDLEMVKEVIEGIFSAPRDKRRVKARSNGMNNGRGKDVRKNADGYTESRLPQKIAMTADLSTVREKLKALVDSVIYHSSVTSASTYDRSRLQYELRTCLLSHITQIEDSREHYNRLTTQEKETIQWIPQGSYHSWLRTVAASHSCAPLSLAYLLCLHRPNSSRETSAEERYLVQDICMHMSNKARLENDRASLTRDRKEKNLNSLDFPEFRAVEASSDRRPAAIGKKEQLSRIVEYERKCCQLAFNGLEQLRSGGGSGSPGAFGFLKFYFFLTDIYNDVYSMKDISCEA